MTPNTIYLADDGIRCFQAPEKPTDYELSVKVGANISYQLSLESAMKQSVLFKDQSNNIHTFVTKGHYIEKGKLYPVPTGYEIKIETYATYNGKNNPEVNFAILVPKQEPDQYKPIRSFGLEREDKQPTSIEEAADSYAESFRLKVEEYGWKKAKMRDFIAGAKYQVAKHEVDLLTIRNKFVAMMPVGDVSAWDCITAMKNYTLWLDEFIEQFKQEKK